MMSPEVPRSLYLDGIKGLGAGPSPLRTGGVIATLCLPGTAPSFRSKVEILNLPSAPITPEPECFLPSALGASGSMVMLYPASH